MNRLFPRGRYTARSLPVYARPRKITRNSSPPRLYVFLSATISVVADGRHAGRPERAASAERSSVAFDVGWMMQVTPGGNEAFPPV
jgi:hypothetical protein